MRLRESEAMAREKEATLLNRFSSHLVSQTTTSGMAGMLLEEVAAITGAAATALYLPDPSGNLQCAWSSPGSAAELEPRTLDLAKWVYEQGKAIGLPPVRSAAEGWPMSAGRDEAPSGGMRQEIVLPLQSASRMEGVLYVGAKTDRTRHTVHDARLLVSIANQAAAFLERGRLQGIANQAEALREADRLKTAFVLVGLP
jgi:K+-sensing histidine kinase KdpD